MLLFNRPLGSRLTLPAIDDPPIHFCNSLSISQELCLRSSLESQSSTSASADPVLSFQPIKTQKLGFTTQKIPTQFSPPILSEANSNIFAVLLADLVRNVRDSKSLQRTVVRPYYYSRVLSSRRSSYSSSMHTLVIVLVEYES